ncbi:MAG: NAD(P)/FAD-dependent oxidoreductase [Thermaceae bacterium]|nr:NAD(P)/FAD-dependent oxidoreductase [Thermaceae bacterium]
MTRHAEVVIAGASFAGLATALALKGRDVVVLDPKPLGHNPKSANTTPLSTLRALRLLGSVREIHPELVIHFGPQSVHLPSSPAFATVDYQRLCQSLAKQAGIEVRPARALGYQPGRVLTDQGEITCRFAVDASGPAAVLASALQLGYARRRFMAAGLETELPRPPHFPGGLHFYLDNSLPYGYAWAFGSGESVRFGLGVFQAEPYARDLKNGLRHFLNRFDLEPTSTHGGLIPLRLREPVVGEVLVVGDAAGQVLPASAEGIRPALYFGQRLGLLLRQALEGSLEGSAQTLYCQEVQRHRHRFETLEKVQRLLGTAPELSGWLLKMGSGLGITRPFLHGYLRTFVPEHLPSDSIFRH